MALTPQSLAVLLGMSLFFGLAFEQFYARENPGRPGGIRTFPMLAIVGGGLWSLGNAGHLAFAAGLLVVGSWTYAFYRAALGIEDGRRLERGIIVPACNLVAYTLGAIAVSQPPWVVVAVTVSATLLLTGRTQLHRLATALPPDEIFTAGQFLLLVGVALPLLPDVPVAGIAAITPHKILLAIVAVSTLSYAGYLLQRYARPKDAELLEGVLGGLYSSTATTVVLSRRSRAETAARDLNAAVVLATGVMYARVLVVVTIFNLPLARALWLALVVLALASAAIALAIRGIGKPASNGQTTAEPPANPLEIGAAIVFALLFVAVTVASGWARGTFGARGIFALAAIVGVTDIDPFVLGIAEGAVASMTVGGLAAAILIATSSNGILKACYAQAFGDRRRMIPATASLASLAVAGLIAAYFVARAA